MKESNPQVLSIVDRKIHVGCNFEYFELCQRICVDGEPQYNSVTLPEA